MNPALSKPSPDAPSGSRPGKSIRALAVLCLALTGALAFAEGTTETVAFKDPSKPGILKVYISRGDLHVKAGDSPTEVCVVSDAEPDHKSEPRSDGLRVLSDTSASFSLRVKDNVADLSYGRESWPTGGSADFEVTVPKNTTVQIENGWGGDVVVEKLSGDVEVKGMNCEVKLQDLSGGACVETMNGEIEASFEKIAPDRALSFSSMNGAVTLNIPGDSKAKVRFRTHHGTILTDFPEDVLKTTSKNLGGNGWANYAGKEAAMATEMAKEVGREMAHAAKEMAAEFKETERNIAKEKAKMDRDKAKMDRERAKADKEAAKADKEAAKADKDDKDEDENSDENSGAQIVPPAPPRPPSIPAISGGKVVTGSINGGGPEILVTTMNGDITLRHK